MKPFIYSLILLLPICVYFFLLWAPLGYSEESIVSGIVWEGDRLIDKTTDQTIFVYVPDAEDISGFFSASKTFPELLGWPIEPPGAVTANLTIGDIDNNGDMEVLFPIFGFDFYAYNHKGQLQDDWPIETHDEIYNGNVSMSLIDIDGDFDLEIFTVAWDSAYGWHHNGQAIAGWPRFIEVNSPGSVSTPALCDCDQDTEIEIIHGTNELAWHLYSLVYMWRENGEQENNWPQIVPDDEQTVNSSVLESPAIGDFNFDGKLEIVVGSDNEDVFAWHTDGTLVEGWPQDTQERRCGFIPPALGDIDGDNELEIVIGTDVAFDNLGPSRVYAWNIDGTLANGWPQDNFIGFASAVSGGPSLGDVDGDGKLEVVAACVGGYGKVFVWNGEDGSLLEGWPQPLEDYNISFPNNTPTIGDIDGDGDMEVVASGFYSLFSGNNDAFIMAWHHDGVMVDGFPILMDSQMIFNSAPTLCDLNLDGKLDIGVGTQKRVGLPVNEGYIHFFTLNAPYNPDLIEWGQYSHDIQHTGLYAQPEPPTGWEDRVFSPYPELPNSFTITQNYPNPFNPSTTIQYDIPVRRNSVPVEINIYDVRGRLVRKLVDQEKESGRYQVHWDGRDEHGQQVSSGVYLYRMEIDRDLVSTKKMVLLK
jgi:hypothetical protein